MSGRESQRHKLLAVISCGKSKALIVDFFVCVCVRGELEKQKDREAAAKKWRKRQDMRDTQLQDVKRLKMLPLKSKLVSVAMTTQPIG